MGETFYQVLGVESTASPQDIKAAYRKQAFRWHPDKNNGSKESEERFKLIAEAYSVLKENNARRQYDSALNAGFAQDQAASYAVNADQAAAMFYEEMTALATELTIQNIPWSRIAAELVKRGCPQAIANDIAATAETYRKSAVRNTAGRAMLWATGFIVAALVVTIAFHWSADEAYEHMITRVLFIFGFVNLIRAGYYLISGRMPGKEQE